jgi:tetratricopeptide (TPR) repeat protein
MSPHLQRAHLLLGQNRHEDAASAAREAVAADPEDPWGYYFLARALTGLEQPQKALEAAEAALARAAGEPAFHLARVPPLLALKRAKEAVDAACTALEFDPESAPAHNALAWSYIQMDRWQDAFDAASAGLRFAPDDPNLAACRAAAERQLGRAVDALETLRAAVARDPEDPLVHAQLGWTWLDRGNPAKALEHFGEALRLDPEDQNARAGLAEALKARNPLYRLYLNYAFFISRLSGKAQWAIWIGAYVVVRIGMSLAEKSGHPLLGFGLIAAYLLFMWSTWTIQPIFNLLLRLDRFGRHALSDDQRRGSNLTAGLLLAGASTGLAALAMGQWLLLGPALAALMMMMPGSKVFAYHRASNRWICAALLGAQACVWVFSIVAALQGDSENALLAAGIVYFSSIAFSWLASALDARD